MEKVQILATLKNNNTNKSKGEHLTRPFSLETYVSRKDLKSRNFECPEKNEKH